MSVLTALNGYYCSVCCGLLFYIILFVIHLAALRDVIIAGEDITEEKFDNDISTLENLKITIIIFFIASSIFVFIGLTVSYVDLFSCTLEYWANFGKIFVHSYTFKILKDLDESGFKKFGGKTEIRVKLSLNAALVTGTMILIIIVSEVAWGISVGNFIKEELDKEQRIITRRNQADDVDYQIVTIKNKLEWLERRQARKKKKGKR
eukprot:snap_masked-scaffold_10-processed-gene-8.35-mRNA-1 protein AED:1.00 eAED:1.00 QI:0/-1/0/0/-1/1/1/0/205